MAGRAPEGGDAEGGDAEGGDPEGGDPEEGTSKTCCRNAAHRRAASVGTSRDAGTVSGSASAPAGSKTHE
ncbi:MAG: hypothetical protein ABI910_01450 [Gemmatimonadota bacterium]